MSRLKKALLSILLLAIFVGVSMFSQSCKEIEELTHFYFSVSADTDIPATQTLNVPVEFTVEGVPTNSEAAFTQNNTVQSLVDKIILSTLVMNLPENGEQTFDFLSSVEIYIFSDDLPEILLGKNTDIPETGLKSINLETSDENLKDYLILEQINITLKITLRGEIVEDTNIDIESTFFVDAEILGV